MKIFDSPVFSLVKAFAIVAAMFVTEFTVAQTPYISRDSVVVTASSKYADPSFFKRIFLGKNYRHVWSTPVKLPVFRIAETGFSIGELGGGQQTKSLRLIDKKGKVWVLRTVDKDVEGALPKWLQNTLAERVTQDMVSAAHPYAPLTIPPMAKAIDVPVADPVFFYVPDDPALGEHREVFAHKVVMLEEREPVPANIDTKSTATVVENIMEENDELVVQKEVLRARLLDMLIADWDRHEDQWRWAEYKGKDVDRYLAIPRDRDQAYFQSKGLLVKVARLFGLRHLVGFRDNLSRIKNLNYKSWDFDDLFLNKLNKKEWENEIRAVQTNLSDTVIRNAVRKLPPEIYPISGPEIEFKLQQRRNDLLKQGLKYYDYLATYVTVFGTDRSEIFRVSSNGEGLLVRAYDKKDGKEGRKFYERTFHSPETFKVSLVGLDGDDVFIVEENASSKVRLEICGGKGNDEYNIKGSVKNVINDDALEKNKVISKSKSKIKIK